MMQKSIFWGDYRQSIQFLAPYLVLAGIVFCAIYLSPLRDMIPQLDGYGWYNSKLLDFWFGVFGFTIDKVYYPFIFIPFYFFISVPVQEYVFRVLPLYFTQNRFIYIWIINAVFTFLHIYYMQPISLIAVYSMGVILAIDYYRNRSFITICIFHFIVACMAYTLNLA